MLYIGVRILRVIQDGIILLDKHPLDQDCFTFTCTNCSLLFQPFGFSQLGLCRSESTGRPGSIYSPNWQYITLIYHLYTTYSPLLYHVYTTAIPSFERLIKRKTSYHPKKTPSLSKSTGKNTSYHLKKRPHFQKTLETTQHPISQKNTPTFKKPREGKNISSNMLQKTPLFPKFSRTKQKRPILPPPKKKYPANNKPFVAVSLFSEGASPEGSPPPRSAVLLKGHGAAKAF